MPTSRLGRALVLAALVQRCCRSHPWGISAADGEVAEREALIVEAARAAGSNETLKAQLAQAFAGAYHAHAVGEHLKFLTEHHAQRAHAQAVEAVAQARAGEWESAHSLLRSAAESSLRGAGRVNLLLLPALGVDEPTRWWVWGWTCLEYYAHSRGHAALQRAAEAFPADERLREEAAKHAAYADARGAEQREDAPGANEQQPALRVSSLSAETPDDGVVRSLAWFGGEPGLIVRTESRVISLEECAWVVAQAEAHAAARGGWSTSRHVAYATTDIPLHTIDTLRAWFPRVLHERLFPLVASAPAFRALLEPIGGARALRVHDCFVVKYTGATDGAEQQKELHAHKDQALISFTIGLNSVSEYDGGGTYFEALDQTVPTDAGHFTAFASTLVHAGVAVTRGTRYVLVLFLYADGWNASGDPETPNDPFGYPWLNDLRDALPIPTAPATPTAPAL